MKQEKRNEKKAVLYVRTATKRDDENGSIKVQIKALRGFAEEHGYQVVAEFVDEAVGGGTINRPAFKEMLKLVLETSSEVDAVLVWSFTRFSRNMRDSVMVRDQLRNKGVNVISLNEQVDDYPETTFSKEMMKVLDTLVLPTIADTTRRGMRENACMGFRNGGKAPLGYRTVKVRDDYNIERSTLEIDEEHAPVIQLVFSMYLDGMRPSEIAEALDTEGIEKGNGTRWIAKAVKRMLSNEVYVGNLVWGQTHVVNGKKRTSDPSSVICCEDSHPAIVDRSVFEKAQTKLQGNRSRGRNKEEAEMKLTAEQKRALLNVRVSTGKKAEKDSNIPAQLEAMREYAEKHGCKIVREFVDEGKSGRTSNRQES